MNRRPLLYVAAVLVVLAPIVIALVLLSGDDDNAFADDLDVHPLDEILASDIVFEWDPAAGTGRLLLDTSVPVACSVVYGTDESFGLIATDDDMAGAAHTDHGPTLRGLEPDTEYTYRVQGTAADGTFYASPVMRFSTGAAPEAGGSDGNLALDATIADVSSEFSPAFAASNAIDGDGATEWSSAGDGDDAYIIIDLGAEKSVSGVGFRTRQMSDGSSVTTGFTVTVDGGDTYGPFDAGPGLATADVAFTGRLVRIDVDTSTGGNTGAVEIEIYPA
jgi:hypothetical protein